MTEAGWWLASPAGGDAEGPYTTDEVRRLAATGRVRRGLRVWSPVQGAWLPFRPALLGRVAGKPAGMAFWTYLAAQSLAFLAATALLIGLIYADGDLGLTGSGLLWAWGLAGPGLAVLSIASLLAWRRAARALGTRRELAAVVSVAAGLFLVFGLLLSTFSIRAALVVIPAQLTIEDWTYDAHIDKASGQISVKGAIGVNFGRRMKELLALAPDPVTVEIESYGGLTSEALTAAEAIEKRGGVTVVARNHCASACLIVLMGAQHRLADADISLAFHASSAVAPVADRFFAWSLIAEGERADAYLLKRGVPKDYIDAANTAGPDQVYETPAALALRRGVLTGVLDGDRPLTEAEVEDHLETARPHLAPADP
ncbi:DUF4339 domain-containing protein [Phenylobacterium sp.]|uniref:DUF4339 domain-containing protein n=1 Tax=Phenylobacterium sp. TaxID=1871053 RepID=UPI00286DD10B|nr:DUF4339 domain-containing protein [Phenylobacterium sp.]